MRDYGDENDYQEPGKLSMDVVLGSPHLTKEINDNLLTSAILGGAFLKDLPADKALQVTTRNTTYVLRRTTLGNWEISGHPTYCPTPTLCTINGSTWGGSMLKAGFVGRGMHLEVNLRYKGERTTLTTTSIQEVEEIA